MKTQRSNRQNRFAALANRRAKPASGGATRWLAVLLIPVIVAGALFFWRPWNAVVENAEPLQGREADSSKADPLASENDDPVVPDQAEPVGPNVANVASSESMVTAPVVKNSKFVAPLADAYERIDPGKDGWDTEAFSETINAKLTKLAKWCEGAPTVDESEIAALFDEAFDCDPLRPAKLQTVFSNDQFVVERSVSSSATTKLETIGAKAFFEAYRGLAEEFWVEGERHVKFKIIHIVPDGDEVESHLLLQADGPTQQGLGQFSANWICRWTNIRSASPKLGSLRVSNFEQTVYTSALGPLFVDCTASLLGETAAYRQQLRYGTDYWRGRMVRDLGLDVVANHGLALGDVNGDDLEDIYICQQGGLPNRLFLQRPDGTLVDATERSGADWLDYTSSALLIDLDNDGDRDLIIGQEHQLVLMSNEGEGEFRLVQVIATRAQTFSLTAADFNRDGLVDVYSCGYNPSMARLRKGAMGAPIPFHDANNGGPNLLLQNLGKLELVDVTAHVGLDENNRRFSFAATWEDFDKDGDPDLYVANDYGRNNLYRNDGGYFTDVAADLGVEDMSAGMSVSWADYNRDGLMDLYISNMFSAAGSRVTFQRQFKTQTDDTVKQQFQRFARGNTLFQATPDGGFRDVSIEAGVSLGRWAWGSRFVDLNNDGWEDLVVANGFISTADTGDL